MVELIRWLNANSGAVLAVLTFLLTMITAFYATATWLALRKMDREFTFRVRPVLAASVRVIPHNLDKEEHGYSEIELSLESTNAPARLVAATGMLIGGSSLETDQFVCKSFRTRLPGR